MPRRYQYTPEHYDEAFRRVKADYEAVKGKPILVRELSGYVADQMIEFELETPAWMRVVNTSDDELMHQVDEWIDPYWNLELISPHPELANAGSFWMYGTSYNLDTWKTQPARFLMRESREWMPSTRKRR